MTLSRSDVMSSLALALIVLFATAEAGRSLLAPTPAPAPAPGASYTVPNWKQGVKIANTTIPLGGTIVIPWQGTHGVFETDSYACPSTYPKNSSFVGAVASGGQYQQTFTSAGTYYFVCPVGDHCSEGQLIAVTVS